MFPRPSTSFRSQAGLVASAGTQTKSTPFRNRG